MTDNDALLAAILQAPEEDSPRLIYADYLDEHDEPERAEFIRLQIEYARSECKPPCRGDVHAAGGLGMRCHCFRKELRERADELLDKPHPIQSNAFAWCQPIRNTVILIGRPWPENMRYRRGFVEWIAMSSRYLDKLDAITAKQPIREVTLKDWPEIKHNPMPIGTFEEITEYGIFRMWTANQVKLAYKAAEDGRHNLTLPVLRLEWPTIKFNLPSEGFV